MDDTRGKLCKQIHGSGVDLDLPDANQIEEAMRGYGPEHMVPIFGDVSYTTPTKCWAALGGYGVWAPSWDRNAEAIEASKEEIKMHSYMPTIILGDFNAEPGSLPAAKDLIDNKQWMDVGTKASRWGDRSPDDLPNQTAREAVKDGRSPRQ